MRIWNGIEGYPREAGPVVATIGNYDGVHLGHQAILRGVFSEGRRRGCPTLLVTFSPHPLTVVAPERAPQLLQSRGQKLESLRQAGLSDVLILGFTAEVAALSGEEFFEQLLLPRVPLAALHVGENFRFGQGRHGDLALLSRLGARSGFAVHGVAKVEIDGTVVSSSAVRAALASGDVVLARRMLGRPHVVSGRVVRGDGRGASLACPTANLETEEQALPADGVYITESRVIAGRFPSMTNVGHRPTFAGDVLRVETHLLEFTESLYGERIDVHFLERLRDERRFPDADALADQLARDRAAALAYFQNLSLSAS